MRSFLAALALFAFSANAGAASCANRAKPFLTVLTYMAWTSTPIPRVEISADGAIAAGPFRYGCPRCESLEDREPRLLEKLARDKRLLQQIQPLENRSCQVFDTSTLGLTIDGHDYGLCLHDIDSFPALKAFLKEVRRVVARHFGNPRQESDLPNVSCNALREEARRRWECRQFFPWHEPEPSGAVVEQIDRSASLSFAIEPAETLPGIPLTLRIAFTNRGQGLASAPASVAVEVTPEKGQPFMAVLDVSGPSYVHGLAFGPNVVLGPGETRTLDSESGASQYGFNGLSCLGPGRYRLRLIAGDDLHYERVGEHPPTLREPWLRDAIVSNEATLTVTAPRGVDAKAWKLVRRKPPSWAAFPFPELWQRYPESSYAAYGVPLLINERDDHKAIIELYGAALRRNPRGLLADEYRLRVSEAHLARGICFAQINDVKHTRAEKQAALEAIARIARYVHLDLYDRIQRMPEDLEGTLGFAISVTRQVRREMPPNRNLEEFLAAVEAAPPDRTRALAFLLDAIGELNAELPVQRDWMHRLLMAAETFAGDTTGWTQPGYRNDGTLSPAETARRDAYARNNRGDLSGALAKLRTALAEIEAAPKLPPIDCWK